MAQLSCNNDACSCFSSYKGAIYPTRVWWSIDGASLTDFNTEEYKQRVSDAADAAATATESAKAYAEACLNFWNS